MHRWIAALVAVGVVTGAPPARATVLTYLDTKQLTEQSSIIVRGRVFRQEAVRSDRLIWTDTFVKVSEWVKGSGAVGQIVAFRQPGGETKTLGLRVAGAAQFSLGEEVLLFGKSIGKRFVPIGMCLGKYRILKDSAGNLLARRDPNGVSIGRFDQKGRFSIKDGGKLVGEEPLSKLLGEVRAHLGRGGRR
jgi:hypothetical protein